MARSFPVTGPRPQATPRQKTDKTMIILYNFLFNAFITLIIRQVSIFRFLKESSRLLRPVPHSFDASLPEDGRGRGVTFKLQEIARGILQKEGMVLDGAAGITPAGLLVKLKLLF